MSSAAQHPEKMVPPSRVRAPYTVGKLNIMRSLWKTFFNFQSKRVAQMTGRIVKLSDPVKGLIWCTIFGLPASWYLRFSSQEQWVQYYADASERLEHNPKLGGQVVEARRLSQQPVMVFARDPWAHLADAFEHLTYSPTSMRNPKPDESWHAWGEPALHYVLEGARQRTMQPPNAFMLARHNAEGNMLTYYTASVARGFVLMLKEKYYRYYHVFFNVPLEERFESRGAGEVNSRRIMAALWTTGGPGGWRTIPVGTGFLRPWHSYSSV